MQQHSLGATKKPREREKEKQQKTIWQQKIEDKVKIKVEVVKNERNGLIIL